MSHNRKRTIAAFSFIILSILIGVYWPLQFAYGPLVYFYVKSLTAPQGNMQRWKVFVHFSPIILYALYLVPFYLLDADIKSRMWLVGHSRMRTDNTHGNPWLVIGLMQLHTYAFLAKGIRQPEIFATPGAPQEGVAFFKSRRKVRKVR